MITSLLILRVLHIGSGVMWAGIILFTATMLEPSIRAAGPEGARVMRELQARKFSIMMPVLGVIVILTGLDLLRRIFPGGPANWVSNGHGLALVTGGAAAVLVLIIGFVFVVPVVKRMPELAQRLATEQSDAGRAAVTSEMMSLRSRMTFFTRLNAVLIAVTVIAMAIARYVG